MEAFQDAPPAGSGKEKGAKSRRIREGLEKVTRISLAVTGHI